MAKRIDRELIDFNDDVGKFLIAKKIDADDVINIESKGSFRTIWYKKEVKNATNNKN